MITSVDRDDLEDGGANHFVNVINDLRKFCPNTTVEINFDFSFLNVFRTIA